MYPIELWIPAWSQQQSWWSGTNKNFQYQVDIQIWSFREYKRVDAKERSYQKPNQNSTNQEKKILLIKYKKLRNRVTQQIRQDNYDHNNNRIENAKSEGELWKIANEVVKPKMNNTIKLMVNGACIESLKKKVKVFVKTLPVWKLKHTQFKITLKRFIFIHVKIFCIIKITISHS